MDKHIKISYCCFEAFKVVARKYLDVESHYLFDDVEKFLGEINMTPADVGEHLIIPKLSDNNTADTCLQNFIEALRIDKMKADA